MQDTRLFLFASNLHLRMISLPEFPVPIAPFEKLSDDCF